MGGQRYTILRQLGQAADYLRRWGVDRLTLAVACLGCAISLGSIWALERWRPPGEPSDLWPRGPLVAAGLRCEAPVWDFGQADPVATPRLQHVFTLKNVSDQTIHIQNVHSDCGCLTASDYARKIPPQGTTEIRTELVLAGPASLVQRRVIVETAGEPPGRIQLGIVGATKGTPAMVAMPREAAFGPVPQGEERRMLLTITRYNGSPVVFDDAGVSDGAIRLGPPGTQGAHMTLPVALTTSGLTKGEFHGRVIVRTKHATHAELIIPVSADVRSKASPLVGSVFVSRLAPGETHIQPLLAAAEPVEIDRIEYSGDPSIEVRLLPMDGEKRAPPIIRVTRRDGAHTVGVCQGSVTVFLSGVAAPIVIPLTVVLADKE